MIERKDSTPPWGGPSAPLYKDTESETEYRRIWAGMAWPDTQPGFIVVVGEGARPDKRTGAHGLRILAEYESMSPSDLVRRCEAYEGLFFVDQIYGDINNRPMMEFIPARSIYLREAPFAGDPSGPQFFLALIRDMTAPTRKVLTFGAGSRLPGLLAGVSPDAPISPAIKALGYSLAALKTYRYWNPAEESIGAVMETIPDC